MKVKITFENGQEFVADIPNDQTTLNELVKHLIETEDVPAHGFIDIDYLDDWFPMPVEGIDY